jgi:hypothetical protein
MKMYVVVVVVVETYGSRRYSRRINQYIRRWICSASVISSYGVRVLRGLERTS